MILSSVCFAAEFRATVESNNISFGQSIQLKLELEGAKATRSIDISALAKDFTIYNQQQFSSYTSVNGAVKAETGWQITLMPKNTGDFVIPAISLQTDHGLLTTVPINISVKQAQTGSKAPSDSIGISLVSTVNKAKAYINEPVIYTLKIVSYKPIANIVLDDIKSNDAIIEKIGEPKQYDQNHGGMHAHIIEIKYAITALKAGKVKISPATMTGELQVPTQTRQGQRFGMFNMFFDNMFELKPFSLKSDTITIDILPPAHNMRNWLPLSGFALSQTWDAPQELKAGETITRKVKMVAKGGFAKQLPSVKDDMQIANAKIYANKPSFSDRSEQDGTVIGIREEEYSVVPQSEGTLTFPEIQIKWWNIKNNKLEIATLPAKTFNVLAGAGNAPAAVTVDYSADEPQQIAAPVATSLSKKSVILYAVIGVLVGVIFTLGLVLAFIFLRKRATKDLARTTKRAAKPAEKEIVIQNAEDLRSVILQYAIKHWQVPNDISLNRLGDALTSNNYSYDMAVYSTLSQYINAAIYADVTFNLDLLLSQWEEFKKSVCKNKQLTTQEISEDYSSLNPT